jgi:hypothetical protein
LNLVDITGRAPDAPNSYAAPVSVMASNANEEIDTSEEEEESGITLYRGVASDRITVTVHFSLPKKPLR